MSHSAPVGEARRLGALGRLNILDTDSEVAFDQIAEVAQQVFGTQGAAVSLVAEERQWFKAACGISLDETPREQSFCTHVIEGDGVMVVQDVQADPRFRDNSLIEEEGIRFYAGAPLSVGDQLHVGTLCLTDPAPRSFGEEDRALLTQLASVATNLLEARLQAHENRYLTSALEQVDEPVSIIEGNPEKPSEARLAWANDAYAARGETTQSALEGKTPWVFENLERGSETESRVCHALKVGEPVRGKTPEDEKDAARQTFTWVLAPVRNHEQITHWIVVQQDTTEQQRVQQAMRTQRDRLQRMQGVAQTGGWEYDPKSDSFTGSNEFYRLIGLPQSTNFDLERAFQLYPPSVRGRVKTAAQRCLEDGSPFDMEVPLVSATGQHREVRVRGSAEREEGRTARMTGTIQDITTRKQREQHLRQANALFEHSQEGFLLFDLKQDEDEAEFVIQRVNPAYEQMSGRRADEVRGRSVRDIHGEEQGAEIASHLRRCAGQGEPKDWEMKLKTNGSMTYWSVQAAPIYGEDGQVQQITATVRNVTERKNREEKIRESRERWRLLVESHRDPVQITVGKTIQYVNSSAVELYGASDPEEIVGRSVLEFATNDGPGARSEMDKALQAHQEELLREEPPSFEYEIKRLDGERRVVEFYSVSIKYEGKQAAQTVLRDVTQQRREEARLRHRATHDQLTGLYRDSVFRERAQQAIDASDEDKGALLYVDLDQFKSINDKNGHHVGDAVLMEAANRICSVVRDVDPVGRMGGDEFAVWSSSVTDSETAKTMAQRITLVLDQPYAVEDRCLQVGASVGFAVCDLEDQDIDGLIQDADAAMYRAKSSPDRSLSHHGPSSGSKKNTSLRAEVRRGIDQNEFEPLFLPVVRLSDGNLVGFEVLARWRREDGNLDPPDVFLGVAEETGMISPITQSVLEEACRKVESLQQHRGPDLSVALSGNFSRQEFFREETHEFVRHLLEEYDLAPSNLTMEVTERLLENENQTNTAVVDRLRSLGVNVEIDDFGTGYSSFHSLLQFPTDGLKLDKGLISETTASEDACVATRSVIEMAKSLGLRVTAEGIETTAQLEVLRDLGCPLGQGFLFSRPVPAGDLPALIDSPPWADLWKDESASPVG